jgi:hypothetical protein
VAACAGARPSETFPRVIPSLAAAFSAGAMALRIASISESRKSLRSAFSANL